MFCDTHGLTLPCKECLNDRLNELEYLRKIEEGYKKKSNLKGDEK